MALQSLRIDLEETFDAALGRELCGCEDFRLLVTGQEQDGRVGFSSAGALAGVGPFLFEGLIPQEEIEGICREFLGWLLREDDATSRFKFHETTTRGCSGLASSIFAIPSCFIPDIFESSFSAWTYWPVGRASDFSFSGVDWTLMMCQIMLPIWAFALVSALYEVSDFWHTQVHGKLYTWPAISRITGIIGWLSIAAFINIACLEVAQKDEVEDGGSGVHILLSLFRVVRFVLCLLVAIVLLRWREQHYPRFPFSARRCGRRRLLLRLHGRTRMTKRFVALFLLGNLVGAEYVTANQQLQQMQDTLSMASNAADHVARDASWPCGRFGMNPGRLFLAEGFRSRFGYGEFCWEGHDNVGLPYDHEVCPLQTDERFAPRHYQMPGRAANSVGPSFVRGRLTSDRLYVNGEYQQRIAEHVSPKQVSPAGPIEDVMLVQKFVLPTSQIRCGQVCRQEPLHEGGYPFCSRSIGLVSWFAEPYPAKGTEWRHRIVASEHFGDLGAFLNDVWRDKCRQKECSYVSVRPRSLTMLSSPIDMYVILFVRSSIHSWVNLVQKVTFGDRQEKYEYYAIHFRSCSEWTRFCRTSRFLGPVNEGISCPSHGAMLVLQDDSLLQEDSIEMKSEADEISVFMQAQMHATLAPELLQRDAPSNYVLAHARGQVPIEVVAWCHPRAAMGSFSVFGHVLVWPPATELMLLLHHHWDRHFGADELMIVPVRPIPRYIDQAIATLIVLPMLDELHLPILVDLTTPGTYMRGTFVVVAPRILTTLQFLQQIVPQRDCVWQDDCKVYMGDLRLPRLYTWHMPIQLYEGAFVRVYIADIDGPLNDDDSTCFSGSSTLSSSSGLSDGQSVSSIEAEIDEADAYQDDENSLFQAAGGLKEDGGDRFGKLDESFCHLWVELYSSFPATWPIEDNTATSLPLLQYCLNFSPARGTSDDEADDHIGLMQRPPRERPSISFGDAATRGRPFLPVYRTTRRQLVDTWLTQGHDLAYEHFREFESGIWQKKLLGWKFRDVDQIYGEPFAVHLLRMGLWSLHIMNYFELENYHEVVILTVFPQPAMLHLDGNTRALHDTVVLAMTSEVAASDWLPLVVQYSLKGYNEIESIRCPPGCCPVVVCNMLGMDALCERPWMTQVSFRYLDTIRVFYDMERIVLPPAAVVTLERIEAAICEDPLPAQFPLREDEMLNTPRQAEGFRGENKGDDDAGNTATRPHLPAVQLDRVSIEEADEVMMMMLPWQQDFEDEEEDFRRALGLPQQIDLPEEAGITIQAIDHDQTDPLKTYMVESAQADPERVFTVYTWLVAGEVAAFARICASVPGNSLTHAFRLEWQDLHEAFPVQLVQAMPQPPPLTLRTMPVDFVGLLRMQKQNGERIFLLDILYSSQPRRVAVIYHTGERMKDLVARVGLREVCRPGLYHCDLHIEGTEMWWTMEEVIEKPHATSFQLHLRSDLRQQCPMRPRGVSLMQSSFVLAQPRSPLHLYVSDWFSEEGTVTIWLLQEEEVLLQEHPCICTFRISHEVQEQCRYCWVTGTTSTAVELVPVQPPPVFLVLPRPHVLAVQRRVRMTPVLCQVFTDGRSNLVAILVTVNGHLANTAEIFRLANPQHDCVYGADCYILQERSRYDFGQLLDIRAGAFVKLYEWERHDSSTHCPDMQSIPASSSPASLVGSSATFDSDESNVFSYRGENTATPDLAATESSDYFSLFQAYANERIYHADLDQLVDLEDWDLVAHDWEELAEVYDTRTALFGFDKLQSEVLAYLSAFDVYPAFEVMFVHASQEDTIFDFDAPIPFNRGSFLACLRVSVEASVDPMAYAAAAFVHEIPTPYEQKGEDRIFLLVENSYSPLRVMICVVLTFFVLDEPPELRAFSVPQYVWSRDLVRDMRLEAVCNDPRFNCKLRHNNLDMPTLARWQPYQGMKLNLDVLMGQCESAGDRPHIMLTPAQLLSMAVEHRLLARAGYEEEDEEVTLMQRMDPHGQTPLSADRQDQLSEARDTVGTLQVSGEDDSLPASMRPQVGIDWLLSVQGVRHYLLEYAQARRRPMNVDLLVHVLFHSFGHTTASGVYCPQWLLQPEASVTRFLNWCQEYTRRLDPRHSRLFSAVGEIYQNMPTIIVVYSMGEFVMPVIVQVLDGNPTNPPFVLVYLAGSCVRVSTIVGWVREQMELAPAVFRYNGRQVAWQDLLELVAGGILQIRMLNDEELTNPATMTAEPGPGMTLTFESHNTWSSTGSSLLPDVPRHTLGLDGRLRPLQPPVPVPASAGYPTHTNEDDAMDLLQMRMTFHSDMALEESCETDFSGLFQFVHREPLLPEMEEVPTEEIADLFRYEGWRRRESLLQIARVTSFMYFEWFRAEALAKRLAWGRFPLLKMYGCDRRLNSHELFLPLGFELNELYLLYEIRFILGSSYEDDERVRLVPVRPNPTSSQQGGEEAFCILTAPMNAMHLRPVMVVATGVKRSITTVLKGLSQSTP